MLVVGQSLKAGTSELRPVPTAIKWRPLKRAWPASSSARESACGVRATVIKDDLQVLMGAFHGGSCHLARTRRCCRAGVSFFICGTKTIDSRSGSSNGGLLANICNCPKVEHGVQSIFQRYVEGTSLATCCSSCCKGSSRFCSVYIVSEMLPLRRIIVAHLGMQAV